MNTTGKFGRASALPRSLRVLAGAAAVALSVAACGGGGGAASTSGTGGVWHVGGSMILSGAAASYGSNMAGGMLAYFEDVNAKGGVAGRKIQLDQADGGLVAAQTIQSIKQLSQQNDAIVIGGLLPSSAVLNAKSAIEQAKVPVLLGSPVTSMVRPAMDYVYGGGAPLFGDEAFMQADFAKAKLIQPGQAPRVAFVYQISAESQLWADNIQKLAAQNGWNVVGVESYQVGTTDFAAQAAKIGAAKPDIIFGAFDQSNFAFIKALMASNVTAPLVANQGGPHADQMQQLNYPALYVGRQIVYPTGDEPAVTAYRDLVKKYAPQADVQSHITQYGYLQAKIIVGALQKCGNDCTPAKMNDTLKSTTSIDTGGFTFTPITYSAQSTQGLDSEKFYTWDKASQQVKLLPESYTYKGQAS
ncbi:ABC transporter substrate-binding protein [Pseudonocardia ailaonensis]|uniref:ABC transporter substrate-binding protein n=1 Tax=Pseudonocardia ailaonensis TaxID=367279 RepID=A0ABN2MYH0_9PSEU